MLRRLRENGPVVLVPLAWTFATAAHEGLVETRTVLIAHLVMATVIGVFAVLSWGDMREGVLLAWKVVLVVGFVLTALGAVGLTLAPLSGGLLWVTVVGWMLLPGAALVYTGQHVTEAPWVYTAGGLLSALGAIVYAVAPLLGVIPGFLVGLTLVNVGQTAGIVNAVYQY